MRKEQHWEDKEIKDFVCQIHEFQLRQIPSQEILKKRYRLSDAFFYKMEKLIRQQERKAKARKICRGIVAAAAVFMLLFTLSNPQYIADAADMVIQWFSDHMSFQFKADTEVNQIPRYEMRYVPEEYELVTDEYDGSGGFSAYVNQEDAYVYFIYTIIDATMNIDNEYKELYLLEGDNGEEIYYLEADDEEEYNSITWVSKDETAKFHISGYISKDELLAIQKEVRIVKEK